MCVCVCVCRCVGGRGRGFADLSRGRAVHARLWDVPAEICWMATPSRPTTFLGLVMGPVELPWPHWPIELLPQAYTSLSGQRMARISKWQYEKWKQKNQNTHNKTTLRLGVIFLGSWKNMLTTHFTRGWSLIFNPRIGLRKTKGA